MSFDEDAAREVTAVRALESADDARTFWTDADREWATRAAAARVGEQGSPEAFLAARAGLALERVGERSKAYPRAVRALRWRPWVGVAIVAVAFVAGVAIDEVGSSHRINLLAPPFLGTIVWNLAVYAALVASLAAAIAGRGALPRTGPLRRLVARWGGGSPGRPRGERAALARFADDWMRLSAPLHAARATRILHCAAAAFAVGLVAGLYVRGTAFEYRATWESTFLGASTVHSVVALLLAPGAWLSGMPVPSAADVAAIRSPAGENAARWLHLMALTILAVVIAPRLVLALAAAFLEGRRSRISIALDDPYFVRLARGVLGGPIRVHVVPYSYAMPAASASGLERLVRGVFGSNASLTIVAPIAYGAEDAPVAIPAERPASVLALFSAAATPEAAAHGVFLERLAEQLAPASGPIALVDEAQLRDRLGDDRTRLDARRAIWRALCADRRVACVCASLAAPEPAEAVAALERAFEGRPP